ncbi:MAG: hypothetical protein Q7K34_00575 [archaeon]|nr:hypothetical protein [archaeon]
MARKKFTFSLDERTLELLSKKSKTSFIPMGRLLEIGLEKSGVLK